MPGLVRKLLIIAAADGLLLHPLNSRERDQSSISIAYGTHKISPIIRSPTGDGENKSLEAHGIVGLLDLISSAYLISITRRDQVAQIQGRPIYTIKDVTLIPLSSQSEAERAIVTAQTDLKRGSGTASAEDTEDEDAGDDAETSSIGDADQNPSDEVSALEPPKPGALSKGTSIVKSVVQDGGKYGRFAQQWFSKGGWTASGRRRQGMTSEGDLTAEQKQQEADALPAVDPESSQNSQDAEPKSEDGQIQDVQRSDASLTTPQKQSTIESLTPRILRSARLYFASSGFFYSHEHDLSGTLLQRDNSDSVLPLWKRFDALYFWNRHLLSPFVEASAHGFVLPIMQGFVGQRAFSISRTTGTEQDLVAEATSEAEDVIAAQAAADEAGAAAGTNQEEFLLTLISRRSVKRAGLRYLRRGVDDDGNAANYVETEQLLAPKSWDSSSKTFSLVQLRGSIPLFFSQTPYSFKPLPVLFGSEATNQQAFKKHFEKVAQRYGVVQAVSLVDKHATEKAIGDSYEAHAKQLNENGGADGRPLGFEWFDFHAQCKGMKFGNVAILLDTLQSPLKSFGWIVKQNGRNTRVQTGVLRTNCMDCLDRTNVVQSAVGAWALQQQLIELGLNIDLKSDPKTQWFNTLWADNGDAISKQYAGTAALKGDFTRTRKRNWTGALSDFSLTLNRYYNNIFGDYFLQLNIDFMLGNVGPSAFDDFEDNMMSQDYALDIRRVRHNAIDTCIKIVLEDPREDLIGGWTLSCPHEANTVRSLPFEECVLLLTNAALYHCRFDWDAEKVGSFERVNLLDVTEIWRGPYITSALGPTQMDEMKNFGFALRYETSGRAVVRTNTRSVQNEKVAEDENASKNELQKQAEPPKNDSRLLAFKALPPKSSAAKEPAGEQTEAMTEQDLVKHICDDIQRLMTSAAKKDRGFDHLELDKVPRVEEKDVISVAEAKRSTGYIESIGHSLKKLVWS